MGGTFILSLDCEGKWGVADHLSARWQRDLSEERLKQAYRAIAALLARSGIAATFAFTELFLRSRDELLALPVDEIAERLPFTRSAFQDLRHGSSEGWTGEWAREAIGPHHEIACHGVTHTPWTQMTPEQARYELSLVPIERGRTFIHPRNAIAHLGLLEEAGFVGYRLARPRSSRAASLASELNPFAAAEQPPAPARLQPIPAGYFINWLSGARRLVPPWLTRRRARHVLEEAARTGGVAHFWTHPENVAAAPGTLRNLEAVIEEAAALRKAGRIEIVTQIDYCRSLAS
jgi:peptidoglycan/xylan/chitin deacetylase (PgdA/CDA1 family)